MTFPLPLVDRQKGGGRTTAANKAKGKQQHGKRDRQIVDWYFYALLCADGTYYAGVTTDLRRRLHEHNKTRKGAKYTRTRRPVSIVYSTRYASRSERRLYAENDCEIDGTPYIHIERKYDGQS